MRIPSLFCRGAVLATAARLALAALHVAPSLCFQLSPPAARAADPGAGPAGNAAGVDPSGCLLFVDFARGLQDLAGGGGRFVLRQGAAIDREGRLQLSTPRDEAELDTAGTMELSRRLRSARALSVGGWFLVRRTTEGAFAARGDLETGPLGERLFRPSDRFANFCLGTDDRGFLFGTIQGNGTMPFPHVTVNDVPELVWSQLVVAKTADGHHLFYRNGSLVHTDREAMAAPSSAPLRETEDGEREPIRLRMACGGLAGELWVVGKALDEETVAADWRAKKSRYRPAPACRPVAIREMRSRPLADLTLDAEKARKSFLEILGPFPLEKPPLEPRTISEEDCGDHVRRKVSIQVQSGDRMPAYVLIPKARRGRVPAIVCFYGTTSGAGKLTAVGLSGRRPGDPPHPNLAFALDVVRAGFVAFAADYLRDGERIEPPDSPYDTTRFYARFPDWSIHGKDTWDTLRAIDYLQTLDFVDPERIGMMGHSYGGHSTIFTSALEPRIRCSVANGPVSAFREHGMHWGVPKGGGNSQSLPALRPYILDPELPLPVTFAEVTALVAPRPLLVGQAAGERRPLEEENAAFVRRVYEERKAADKVRYIWYAGDHDFPPAARRAAVDWFRRWLGEPSSTSPARN